MVCMLLFSSKQCIKKQFFRVGFSDILNKEGLGKCYQPRLGINNVLLLGLLQKHVVDL